MLTTKPYRPELSTRRVATTEPEDLQVNDTFVIIYGFDHTRFRVHRVLNDGVWAHGMKWMKSSSIFLSWEALRKRNFQYYNRISKLRAFFIW